MRRVYRFANGYEVWEQAPRRRTIMKQGFWRFMLDVDAKLVRVRFPYVVFVGCPYGDLRVFFRNRPLRRVSDVMRVAPMPNVFPRGKVCQPGTRAVAGQIAMFWDTTFTHYDSMSCLWGGKLWRLQRFLMLPTLLMWWPTRRVRPADFAFDET